MLCRPTIFLLLLPMFACELNSDKMPAIAPVPGDVAVTDDSKADDLDFTGDDDSAIDDSAQDGTVIGDADGEFDVDAVVEAEDPYQELSLEEFVRQILEPADVTVHSVALDQFREQPTFDEARNALAKSFDQKASMDSFKAQAKLLIPTMQIALREPRLAEERLSILAPLFDSHAQTLPIEFNKAARVIFEEARAAATAEANGETSLIQTARVTAPTSVAATIAANDMRRIYRSQANAFSESNDEVVYFAEPAFEITEVTQTATSAHLRLFTVTVERISTAEESKELYIEQLPYGNPGKNGKWESLDVAAMQLNVEGLAGKPVQGQMDQSGNSYTFTFTAPYVLSEYPEASLTIALDGVDGNEAFPINLPLADLL